MTCDAPNPSPSCALVRTVFIAMAVALLACGCGETRTAPSSVTMVSRVESSVETSEVTATKASTTAPASPPSSTTTPALVITKAGKRTELRSKTASGIPVEMSDASALDVSESGAIAVGNSRGELFLFNAEGALLGQTLTAHEGKVSGLTFLGSSNRLLSSGGDGYVRDWSTDGASNLVYGAQYQPFGGPALTAITSSSDGSWVAVGAVNSRVAVMEATSSGLSEPSAVSEVDGPPASMQFSSEARVASDEPPQLLIGNSSGLAQLIDIDGSVTPIGTTGGVSRIGSLAPVGGSRYLLSGSTTPVVIDTESQSSEEHPAAFRADLSVDAVASWWRGNDASVLVAIAGSDGGSGVGATAAPKQTGTPSRRGELWMSTLDTSGGEPVVVTGFVSQISDMRFLPDASGIVVVTEDLVVVIELL